MYSRMHFYLPSFVLLLILHAASLAFAADVPANADFDQGDTSPVAWTLSGGQGRWIDRQVLEVTGSGNDSNHWRTDYPFAPGGLYRFKMLARSPNGGGSAISGPSFANRDYGLSSNWNWYGHVFRASDDTSGSYLRLGQWHAVGPLQFDAVRLAPVMPIYKTVGSVQLGDGESIAAGRYAFAGSFAHEGSNFHRPLISATADFNSDRWCFGGKQQITYRFTVPGCSFRSGKVAFEVNHYGRGGCVAEISRDNVAWRSIATRDGLGHADADVPADLLPAETLYLRLRCATDDSYFQVNGITFTGDLTGTVPDAVGRTDFAEIDIAGKLLAVESMAIDDSSEPSRPTIRLTAKNLGSDTAKVTLTTQAVPQRHKTDGQDGPTASGEPVGITPGQTHTFVAAIPLEHCGVYELRLVLRAANDEQLAMSLPWTLPNYYETGYGQKIQGIAGPTDLWWCDATWKVNPQRPSPEETSPAATMSAARNDHEAVQIVVRPATELKQLTAVAGALAGPNGATIPAEDVQVLRVYYHTVHTPTDGTSVVGDWPDALPPLDKPLDLPAGKNQPLWILVHVPKDAKPGDYTGSITLKAEGWSAAVPLRLHVWNFALPETNHIETAFGLNMANPFRYQQIKSEADKRRIVDMYLQSFADHRISPYNPTPLESIHVKFVPEADPPRAELDFADFDAAMSRSLEKYHFTNFVLPIHGMGGGDWTGRGPEPKIGEFGENTPQYQAMFSSCVKQLEAHLREKGWLNMAYTYWYDEPSPDVFPYVRNGMERLKKYAPGIQNMLTKEPHDELGNAIDIWCPLTPEYRNDVAQKRRAEGNRFWWYVCCAPKAPFCTLFVDHPATELRTWLWQTWQHDVVGILIWESAYWTPQGDPQNPYQDPMGYVSTTKPEQKQYWGNGDGRFLYPPLCAATPGLSGNDPVIEPPVSSIRWEMLREGIEDYEFLWLLRDLIDKKRASLTPEQVKTYQSLLEVPEAITSDMTTFTVDPKPIYARRAAIAEAIEQLIQ